MAAADQIPAHLALEPEPFADDELAEYLEAQEVGEAPSHHERIHRWRVENDDQAEWAFRKLADLADQVEQLEQQRDRWAEKITEWFNSATRPLLRSVRYFEALLGDYAARRYDETGRATAVNVPSGKVTSRPVGGTLVIDEPDLVAEWIREHLPDQAGELLKVEPRLRELGKAVTIKERLGRYEWRLALECGHDIFTYDEPDDSSETPPAVVPCPACPLDPIDGAPPLQKVTEGERAAIMEKVVMTSAGEQVPGVSVKPEGRNFTVKPGGAK